MTLRVRRVDLDHDREELMTVLERNLTEVAHRVRFAWLYLRNPAGMARSWLVEDTGRGGAVGAASVFPRYVWLDGRVRTCGQVGDFGIDVAYRTLGPAVLLQRGTMGPVEEGAVAFYYDCPPHPGGMAPFRRLGLKARTRMERHVRVVRVDRWVRRWVPWPPLARPVSWLGNAMLGLLPRRGRRSKTCEIGVHSGGFGEEFSWLDRSVTATGWVRNVRSAEVLNWRYRDDPLHRYVALTARAGGELLAYAVLRAAASQMEVVDLFGRNDRRTLVELLDAATALARRQGAETLTALLGEETGLQGALRQARFRYRSLGAHVVAYARPGTSEASSLENNRWWFLHSDVLA